MKVFLVIGSFGDGGITTALFNRAAMFLDAGVQCAILHLDYRADLGAHLEELRQVGRLRSDVEVLSPFQYLSDAASTPATDTKDDAPLRPLEGSMVGGHKSGSVHYFGPDEELLRKEYFDADGRLWKVTVPGSAPGESIATEFSSDSTKLRELRCRNEAVYEERYFAPAGEHFLTRTLDPETGAQRNIQVEIEVGAFQKSYSNNTRWHTAWFEHLAASLPEKPVFICDGPGSAAKVLNLDPARGHRAIVLHDNHFADKPYSPGSPIKPRVSFLNRIKDLEALVVLTEEQAADVIADFGNAGKISVIPNSLPYSDAPDVERDPFRVAMFGKLIDRKGTDHAVKAFKIVVESVPEATLHIFGAGPQKAALERLINASGLQGKVSLHGYTNQPAVEMAKASAVVFPSKSEAWGFTIAEAFMAETPVIAYACKYGPSDLIDNDVDGILVPEGDIDGLAAGVVKILADDASARSFGQRGRAKMLSLYTAEPLMGRWNSLFQILARKTA